MEINRILNVSTKTSAGLDQSSENATNDFLVISCDFIPPEAKTFLKCTRDQVEHPKVIVTATSFTFGREDLLPHIFKQLIQQPLLKEIFQNYHLRAPEQILVTNRKKR